MTTTLFTNALIFDGLSRELSEGHVLVEDGVIREVSDTEIGVAADIHVEANGRTLMPGLIDLHVHIWAADMVVVSWTGPSLQSTSCPGSGMRSAMPSN